MAGEGIALWLGVGGSPASPQKVVSVFCENNSDFRLAMKADRVFMTKTDPNDLQQQWIQIDMGHKFQDEDGYPAFMLINKASGKALAHGYKWRDRVIPQVGTGLDDTILWTREDHNDNGFAFVRMLTNIHLNLDADMGDHQHGGGVKEGTQLSVYVVAYQENQRWKFVELTNFQQSSANPQVMAGGLPVGGFGLGEAPEERPKGPQKVVSVFCENNSDFRLAMKADRVFMTKTDTDDLQQQWIQIDMGHKFQDEEGYPAFMLINKASGKALAHGYKWRDRIIPQVGTGLDGTILWTREDHNDNGFAFVRMLTNIHLNLDADMGDHQHGGGVKEGTQLSVYVVAYQENQRWKFVELTKSQQGSTNPDPQVVDI